MFFQSTQSGTITTRVLVDNGDIFYAGYEQGNRCKVWKNGEVLYELTIGASITSIAYWNGDIYTAGYEKDAETQNTIATVWKNDRPYHLTDGSTNAFARSVAVSKEGVVHVVGYQFNNNNTAIHWIDGVPTYLSESPRSGVAWEIALADGDVYITGQISNKAVLWKNDGEPKSLASDLYSNGKSLAIENGNVYVLGSDRISSTSSNNAAAIWKNDEPVKIISSGDNGVDPYSVAVWNGDVYAVGRYSDDRYVWWKNDVETEFNYPEDQYQPGVFNISIYTGPAR